MSTVPAPLHGNAINLIEEDNGWSRWPRLPEDLSDRSLRITDPLTEQLWTLGVDNGSGMNRIWSS